MTRKIIACLIMTTFIFKAVSGGACGSAWVTIDYEDGTRLFLGRPGYEVIREAMLEYLQYRKLNEPCDNLPDNPVDFAVNLEYVALENGYFFAKDTSGHEVRLQCPQPLREVLDEAAYYADIRIQPVSRGWQVWRRTNNENSDITCVISPYAKAGSSEEWDKPVYATMTFQNYCPVYHGNGKCHYLFIPLGSAPSGGKICFMVKDRADQKHWWDNNNGQDYLLPRL